MRSTTLASIPPVAATSAAAVLAEAFVDNPIERAVFDRERSVRRRQLMTVFSQLARVRGLTLHGAYADGELVGAAAAMPFGRCRPKLQEQISALGQMLSVGLPATARFSYWMLRWGAAEPRFAHRHLQLLGVLPRLQGAGIGSRLLEWYCDVLDRNNQVAYHETDKPENVVFYRSRGFETVGELDVLGVRTWRLQRPSSSRPLRTDVR